MTRYRKKPVAVEAMQFKSLMSENEFDELLSFVGDCATFGGDERREHLVIKTLEGNMRAYDGDWIIKGVKGEVYPCKPDIFEATYEVIGNEQ